jgi:hypothetical protein
MNSGESEMLLMLFIMNLLVGCIVGLLVASSAIAVLMLRGWSFMQICGRAYEIVIGINKKGD